MNRTRYIPAIVMLTSGFVVSIVTFINKYSLRGALGTIFFTMLGFLILGYIIKFIVNKFIILPMLKEAEEEASEEINEELENEESEEELKASV
ncbi:MAG: hypothetical protein K2M60_08500 [Lachnospiraceae bacterium]|nr:hypothetical protein [Lachnospiraceae bacterium]MDE6253689.1 hypothetical protein [Lachnospiraceae bacterium]